ncbi:MAG TPA: two-component regulator propeller domain-containing protein, partial [Bacteroidales bacterium]|nr:two-component regulator propeller domain-containing protein [Bacteroidales bacterium]
MRSSSTLLLIFIAIAIPFNLRSEDRKFRHFTTIQGLSYNTVYDIEQNKEGFIWIATGEGLNRYDSYGFKIYYSDKSENSIQSNDVRSLQVTSGNRLYVGTTGGLCLFRPEYDDFTRIFFGDESIGEVHDILQTTSGKILVSSRTGVYYISEPGGIEEKLPLENDMLQLQEDSTGNFWSFKRQRLFCFDHKGKVLKTYYVKPEGFPKSIPSAISSIRIDSHNILWIGTFRNGLVLFDPAKEEFMPAPLKPGADRHPMYFVRDITEDQDGKYWIGTEKGLFIYDHASGSIEHYLQSFDPSILSINDNAVYKIFRSRENIMWLGTYFGGLNFSEPLQPGFMNIQPGIKKGDLQGKALSQMIVGPDGKLWIATEDAGIAIYDKAKNSFEHILNFQEPGNDLIRNNIHALTSDKDGKIWSGNFFGGINEIDPGNFRIRNFSHAVNDTGSLINNFVFALYCDPSGLLWIGTMDGIDIFNKRTEKFTRFRPDIFRGKFIYDIFPDKQGNYWFCTNDNSGLYRYDKSSASLENFSKDSTAGLNGSSFICHWIDSRGKIWFGSRGDGLVLYDPEIRKFRTYDREDGLPNGVIYGILEDDQNNLWLSSNKGISKFNYITGEIRNFTVDHGLTGNQFNYKSYLKTDDGTMYFGAVNGLTYFHPNQIRTFESEPEIH